MSGLLARRPAFARLWAAGTISLIGDWLSLVAVSLLAVDRGGGALALAGVFAAHALPGALASPLAGVLVDRLDRRRLLVGGAIIQAALTLVMAAGAAAGALAVVQLALLARSAVASLVPPAEAAAVRQIVARDELLAANALLASTWSAAFVVGMALGGVLAMAGPVLAIGLDAASFVACAAVAFTLPALPAPAAAAAPASRVRIVIRDLRAALGDAIAQPRLLRATLAKVPVAVAGGAGWLSLNLIAAAQHPFGSAALSLGVLQAVRGAGTGLGPLLAAALERRGLARHHLVAAAYTLAFAGMAAFACGEGAVSLASAALAWGTGSGANWVLSQAELQHRAGDHVIGRLAALDELAVAIAMITGATAAAFAIDGGHLVSTTLLIAVAGGFAAWGALVALTRGGPREPVRSS